MHYGKGDKYSLIIRKLFVMRTSLYDFRKRGVQANGVLMISEKSMMRLENYVDGIIDDFTTLHPDAVRKLALSESLKNQKQGKHNKNKGKKKVQTQGSLESKHPTHFMRPTVNSNGSVVSKTDQDVSSVTHSTVKNQLQNGSNKKQDANQDNGENGVKVVKTDPVAGAFDSIYGNSGNNADSFNKPTEQDDSQQSEDDSQTQKEETPDESEQSQSSETETAPTSVSPTDQSDTSKAVTAGLKELAQTEPKTDKQTQDEDAQKSSKADRLNTNINNEIDDKPSLEEQEAKDKQMHEAALQRKQLGSMTDRTKDAQSQEDKLNQDNQDIMNALTDQFETNSDKDEDYINNSIDNTNFNNSPFNVGSDLFEPSADNSSDTNGDDTSSNSEAASGSEQGNSLDADLDPTEVEDAEPDDSNPDEGDTQLDNLDDDENDTESQDDEYQPNQDEDQSADQDEDQSDEQAGLEEEPIEDDSNTEESNSEGQQDAEPDDETPDDTGNSADSPENDRDGFGQGETMVDPDDEDEDEDDNEGEDENLNAEKDNADANDDEDAEKLQEKIDNERSKRIQSRTYSDEGLLDLLNGNGPTTYDEPDSDEDDDE